MPIFPWQQRAVATRPTEQRRSPPLEGGRVTYLSTNTSQAKATFVADAPEGSKHAARLRQLAMQNHRPDFEPLVEQTASKKLTLGKSDSRRMLTARGEQTNGKFASPPLAVAAQSRSQTSLRPLSSQPTQQRTQQRSFSSSSPLPSQQTAQLQRRQSSRPSTMADVYRYEKDGQIEYHSRAPTGKLSISAPQGSMEAMSMDAAAARLRVPSVSERDRDRDRDRARTVDVRR